MRLTVAAAMLACADAASLTGGFFVGHISGQRMDKRKSKIGTGETVEAAFVLQFYPLMAYKIEKNWNTTAVVSPILIVAPSYSIACCLLTINQLSLFARARHSSVIKISTVITLVLLYYI
ncbi:hypothetical protein [Paenibacillus sp. IITD108]|uniref:hypothetical protein n=1 Tax=Paenibacillus sp. IITD108 TaxID=3116649 RepID=UPI002F3FB034